MAASGNRASGVFVSCRHATSGFASASHSSTLASRLLMLFTLNVAIFMRVVTPAAAVVPARRSPRHFPAVVTRDCDVRQNDGPHSATDGSPSMNLHRLLLERAASRKPLRVVLIGAGKFGSMFLSQAKRTPGLHVVAVADLDVSRAKESLARV